jgi:hypothetical protein
LLQGQILKTDADFYIAGLFGIAISVTQDGKHVGSGHIVSQNKHVLEMIDGCFFKDACVFTVCSSIIKNRNT